jgi:hypothetical protein
VILCVEASGEVLREVLLREVLLREVLLREALRGYFGFLIGLGTDLVELVDET